MKKYFLFLIIGGLLILHAAVFSILPLPDPSEARYAVIAEQMADSGNFTMPMIWIEGTLIPFMSKPPFGFWTMAGCIKLFGAEEFAVRLPAFIAGILMLLVMFFVLKRCKGIYYAVTSVLITATSGGFYILSGMAMVDMWLTLFSAGSLFFYYGFLNEPDRKNKKLYSLAVFFFLGLGFLTKGPVCLIYFGIPVFFWTFLNRRWQTLREHSWIPGIMIFCLTAFPWFFLAEIHTAGYLRYFFLYENLMRFISPDKSHDLYSDISHYLPPGTAIAYILLVFLPWTLVVPVYYSWRQGDKYAVVKACLRCFSRFREKFARGNTAKFAFFPTAAVSTVFFWCFSSHIMPYYMVPVIPSAAVWASCILRNARFSSRYIIKLSIILLAVYAFAYIPGAFIVNVSGASTRNIIRKALRLRSSHHLKGRLVFVRRMEYSAYFYGGKLVVPHGKESIRESFTKHNNTGKTRNIYIIPAKYLARIPDRAHLEIIYRDGNWIIALRRNNAEKPAVFSDRG